MLQRRRFAQWGASGLLAPALGALPKAQAADAYPIQPIKIIVSSAAGGLVDGIARTIGERIAKPLGQPVLIDPKPGANGAIAASFVAKAPADGHTLLFAVNSFVLAPLLMAKPGYDVFKDFAPVSLSNYGLLVFAVGEGVPAKSMREFVAMAKAQPGKLSFGSAGQGSSGHLYGEKLMRDEGLQMTHVPYKGGAPLMIDILGGQVQGGFVTMGEALPHAKSGRAKLLGVFGTRRMPLAPQIPTFTEQGFKGYEHGGFWGFFAPTGTPQPAIEKLAGAVRKAVAQPDLQERMIGLGLEPSGEGPGELMAAVRRENLLWSRLIKDMNLKLE